jgi:hypothetical protein
MAKYDVFVADTERLSGTDVFKITAPQELCTHDTDKTHPGKK